MKINSIITTVVLAICAIFSIPVFAYQITIGELSDFVSHPGDKLDGYIANSIENKLRSQNMRLANGRLVFSKDYPDKKLHEWEELGYCIPGTPRVTLKDLHVDVAANSDTVLLFSAQNPTNLNTLIQANLDASTSGNIVAEQRSIHTSLECNKLGICGLVPNCETSEVWRIPFSANTNADGHVNFDVELPFLFNDQESSIYLDPEVTVSGRIDNINSWNISPFGEPIVPFSSSDLEGWINEKFLSDISQNDLRLFIQVYGNQSLRSELEKLEQDLKQSITDNLGPDGLLYKIPVIDPKEHVLDILAAYLTYEVIDNGQWLNPGYEYLRDNYRDLAYFALTGDKEGLRTQVVNAATCIAINQGRVANMPYTPLYQLSGGSCSSRNLRSSVTGQFYSDAQCSNAVDFKPTSLAQFCSESLDVTAVGNADVWDGANGEISSTPWTLLPSTQINIGVTPIDANHQPFTKRVKYKTIDNAKTNPDVPAQDRYCKLEMRIYTKDITANNLKPIIAIHGGSWSYRGFGFQGLETQVSQLTERGYVVFSPFYRLTRELDGPAACNNVTGEEILDDMKTAFAWVEKYKEKYGATGKVSLFGQSAGAFLANWMAVTYPEDIDKALLLYPPTDSKDYIDEVYLGNVPDALGVNALKALIGDYSTDPNTFDIPSNDPLVLKMSYPQVIEQQPSRYPAMFIIHGESDSLVPSRQSVRLCNALAGNANSYNGPAINDGGDPYINQFSKTYHCGHKDSRLVLIAEADHMLDACPKDFVQKLAGGQVADAVADRICPAGSIGSVREAEKQLLEAYRWLTTDMAAIMAIINSLLL